MTENQLRKRMERCNLSKLAELSGVSVRHLRLIRNGVDGMQVRRSTIEQIAPHLDAATPTGKEAKRVRASVPKAWR